MKIKSIALLGANSHIGKGLISEIKRLRPDDFDAMALFARDTHALNAWMNTELNTDKPASHPDIFGIQQFDVVINAIGVTDTTQIARMGSQIFDINRHYDEQVMRYLDAYPDTKYVYMSSGSVYGGEFAQPSNIDTYSKANLNTPASTDWYGLAKINSEILHRSRNHLPIVDIRIFGYVSAWLPIDKPFFLANIARSLERKVPLQTDRKDFWRDYIGPTELAQMVLGIIDSAPCNTSVDLYSAAPILKTDLLDSLVRLFSLVVEYGADTTFTSNAIYKFNYFSEDRRAQAFGYLPERTAEQVVIQELSRLLGVTNVVSGGAG
jgi:nucleoside-diphosphate-sugar epimerase